MKKLILLSCLLPLSAFVSFAQNAATPNPGFESWTQQSNYWNPDSWNNLNSSTWILGVFTCQRASAAADVHSGSYAIKLTTKSVFGITANGIASTATLITSPPYGITGGIPYTERPDSIVGWYKYTPANANDSGFVQFALLTNSYDTIGMVKFNTPNTPVATYTRFSKEITYLSPATPELSYWILSASDGVNPVINSSMIVDDVDLIFVTTPVAGEPAKSPVTLLSNLVQEEIIIKNPSEKQVFFELTDLSGRMVMREKITHHRQSISSVMLNHGLYMYRLSDLDGSIHSSGKVIRY